MRTEQRRSLTGRLTVLQYLVCVLFASLAVSFWVLQVAQHRKYEEMAENNRQRTLALRAPRGVVFDRDGKVLVENRRSFSISIDRERTVDMNRTVSVLATALGMDEAGIKTVIDRHRREPSYRPIMIVQDATRAQVAAVMARRLELPEIVIEQVPTRRYPEAMAAHLFGYVGEVNDAQVNDQDGLKSGDIVGQSGIEKIYNAVLMGEDGARRVVVNSVGREIRTLDEDPPIEGKRLQLTLDYDVQKAIEEAFDAIDLNGAAVALDPMNGEVLGFTSRPGFDPNAFAAGIDRATWTALMTDKDRPLNDRAIQGTYPPGSTFKMAVALAALEEGVITPEFHVFCPGHMNFYGRDFKCWRFSRGGHGSVDLRRAIQQSCDVYFYTVANMVGVDKINKWSAAVGLGVKSGIDLPNEVQGLVPSTEWKREKKHEKWYAGETISVGIGQGAVSVTPVSMAVYMATLANGGVRVTPHLVKAVDDGEGWKPMSGLRQHTPVSIDPEKLRPIREGMWMAVNEPGGTGGAAKLVGYDVAGKTGTAQVISNQGKAAAAGKTARDLRDNGWFVFFAPRDNPQIAGVVLLEHGVHGGNAAMVVHHILDTFFAKRDGRPLPPKPVLTPNLNPSMG
jgi:penicillin-binding protein 2